MSSLENLVKDQPVFIVDLCQKAYFGESHGDTAVVYDSNDSWYTVHVDNLAVLH